MKCPPDPAPYTRMHYWAECVFPLSLDRGYFLDVMYMTCITRDKIQFKEIGPIDVTLWGLKICFYPKLSAVYQHKQMEYKVT